VELPETYQNESWLKRIDSPVAIEKPYANLNPIAPADVSSLKLASPSKRAKNKKRHPPEHPNSGQTKQ